jgi:hypothetical protein
MVAIAAISLLVGGIGIAMDIVLATVMERTDARNRRAPGNSARRNDRAPVSDRIGPHFRGGRDLAVLRSAICFRG